MKKLLAILLLVSMVLTLCACGGGQNNAEGDRIVRMGRTMNNLTTLDVWRTSLNPTFQVSDAIFDRLLDKNPETLELQCNLLEDFPTISEDRLTYTFKLKEGVKFHDGTELTSEDVEFTFNYFYDRDTASDNTWVCEVIKGCQEMMNGEADTLSGFKVIDKYSFSIELLYPYGAFESVLAVSMLPILPKKARLEAGEDWGLTVAVGSGPYKLKSFEPGKSLELVVNPDYHGTVPNVDGIKMMNMDTSTALIEWEAGNIDVAEVPSELVPDYQSRFPSNLTKQVVVGTVRLQLNCTIAPLDDVNVRKAIAMAIDKTELVEGYYNNNVVAINGIIPDGIPGFNNDIPSSFGGYDPEGAKQLLIDSGYPDGVTFTATVRDSSTSFPKELQLLKEQLAKANITMEIEKIDSAGYTEKRNSNNMQSMLADWYADFIDADMYLYSLFHSSYSDSYSVGLHDDWYDSQVELARTLEGDEKRELYEELDDYLAYEQFCFVPLYQDASYFVTSDRVSGVFIKKDCLYTFSGASIQ